MPYNKQWYRVTYFDHTTGETHRATLQGRTAVAEWRHEDGSYIMNEDDRLACTNKGGAYNQVTYRQNHEGQLVNRCTYRIQSRWMHIRIVAIDPP
jgi:hypothetical protein